MTDPLRDAVEALFRIEERKESTPYSWYVVGPSGFVFAQCPSDGSAMRSCDLANRTAQAVRAALAAEPKREPDGWQCRFSRESGAYCGATSTMPNGRRHKRGDVSTWPECQGDWRPFYLGTPPATQAHCEAAQCAEELEEALKRWHDDLDEADLYAIVNRIIARWRAGGR